MSEGTGRRDLPIAAIEVNGCSDESCTPVTSSPGVEPTPGDVVAAGATVVTATITYNANEAIVAIPAGTIADSTALIGFGLDSVITVASVAAVA
ncbi:hypothetical protein [Amycolatopsis australiensis]|uniref:hypothetical protein n=1 Tax=Amycolatopsis australiensis TaxID=546364 RepID=UPI003CCBBB39